MTHLLKILINGVDLERLGEKFPYLDTNKTLREDILTKAKVGRTCWLRHLKMILSTFDSNLWSEFFFSSWTNFQQTV